MPYDPRLHHRRSIRLRGYDYAGGGAYFITICAQDKQFLFGQIVGAEMVLNDVGSLVQKTWHQLPNRFQSLILDSFQMMPNHLHGIFVLPGPGLEPALACAVGAPVIEPFANRRGRACPTPLAWEGEPNMGRASPPTPEGEKGRASPPPTLGGEKGRASPPPTLGDEKGRASPPPTLDGEKGRASPPPTARRTSMGDVVGAFKSISAIAINKYARRPGARPLQENFYEHIIRDLHELTTIRDYILHNPDRWADDPENPANT